MTVAYSITFCSARRDALDGATSVLGGALLEEVPGEQLHVGRPLPERGEEERDHPQAVEQVGAEPPLLDLAPQRPVGRRDDAHVDRDRGGAAHRDHGLVLEHAQQFCLHFER
mgnify:CR=1 FL=1